MNELYHRLIYVIRLVDDNTMSGIFNHNHLTAVPGIKVALILEWDSSVISTRNYECRNLYILNFSARIKQGNLSHSLL
jgi:hypothetical protein